MNDVYVMVFPISLLGEIGYFQGLSFETEKYMQIIIDQKNYMFKRRQDVEEGSSYKQPIPYAILNYKDRIFSYRRGKLLSEERLIGNYSIGAGGHISANDSRPVKKIYEEGLCREIEEEIKIENDYKIKFVALLNDDRSRVNKVHFGLIYIAELNEPLVEVKESSINEGKFISIPELKKDIRKYEDWSQICINHIEELLYKFRELCGVIQPLLI